MINLPLALVPLALGMPGPAEWFFIAAAALLIFGKRLPEVGRSLGQGIVEFKKGLKGLESEVTSGMNSNSGGSNYSNSNQSYQQQQQQPPQIAQQSPPPNAPPATAYKFDPYTGKPIEPQQSNLPPNSSPQ